MDRNKVEIKLLQKTPEKLLLRYQEMIRTIVRIQSSKGLIKHGDIDDFVQEINKKLLERMKRIQNQYNHSSQLRTYFSKIILNICLEEMRKGSQVMEPQPEHYGKSEIADEPVDNFLFKQEYERFERVILLLDHKGRKILLLLKMMYDLPVYRKDLVEFSYHISDSTIDQIFLDIKACRNKLKKEKLAVFSKILYLLEGKEVPPDSLRKWYRTYLDECLRLMNGNPVRSSYTEDSLAILIEKMITTRK